jgi:RNase H-like domain found in reverse transcriptase
MDDMAIHTKPRTNETKEQHLQQHQEHIHHILDKLERHNLYLKPEKCDFEQKQIDYLGIVVGQNKVHMDQGKIDQVARWIPPNNPTEVRKFLGFIGYYCYFVKNYSKIAQPLLDLTKKSFVWNWGSKQKEAFEELRDQMCTKPILTQPNFERRFYLQTDASGYGLGAILLQEGGSDDTLDTPEAFKTCPKLHPIAYYSATFTPTE